MIIVFFRQKASYEIRIRDWSADVCSSDLGGQFLAQVAIVRQQFRRVEALPALQRVLAQHPGTESVDGEDGGEIDFHRRLPQPPAQRVVAFATALTLSTQDGAGQSDFRVFFIAFGRVEQLEDRKSTRLNSSNY